MLYKHTKKIIIRNYGWISRIIKKKNTYFISIHKPLVIGGCLKKGEKVFSYYGEDGEFRPVMITYLDGRPRAKAKLETVNQNGFVELQDRTKILNLSLVGKAD